MFKFDKEQKIIDIAGVQLGGQPGQLPTVLIGSIFYQGQRILKDEKMGIFDRNEAERLLNQEIELSEQTGNPKMVDVVGSWPEAFVNVINFIAGTTDGPFVIDGATTAVKLAGVKHVAEVGLSNRVIYNSITPHTRDDELSAIKDAKIKSAILLTLNTRNITISGRMETLDNLLTLAQKAGIENILVDTMVLDIPDPGPVSKTSYLVKEQYGLPVGAGIHNAVDMWRKRRKLDITERLLANSVASVFPISLGADFLLYGPIENASSVYFYCSLADAYVTFSMRQQFRIKPLTRNHPLFKIFRP